MQRILTSAKPALALLLVVLSMCTLAAEKSATNNAAQVYYKSGSQTSFTGPAEYFTGDVKVAMIFPGNDTAHYGAAYVTFQPGARTTWHSHPVGQHMVVTSGIGLSGTRDGKVITISKGDALWCPPGIDHWHGATAESAMTHLVVTASKDGANVVWKEHVSDEIYRKAQP